MEENQFTVEVECMRRKIYTISRIVMAVTYLVTLLIILAVRDVYVMAAMLGVQFVCVLIGCLVCHHSDKIICRRLLNQRHKNSKGISVKNGV